MKLSAYTPPQRDHAYFRLEVEGDERYLYRRYLGNDPCYQVVDTDEDGGEYKIITSQELKDQLELAMREFTSGESVYEERLYLEEKALRTMYSAAALQGLLAGDPSMSAYEAVKGAIEIGRKMAEAKCSDENDMFFW